MPLDGGSDLAGSRPSETNTTASRACHCCSAIVHAPMWNSGYGHTMAPRGSSRAPGQGPQHVDPVREHRTLGRPRRAAREEHDVGILPPRPRRADPHRPVRAGQRAQPVEREDIGPEPSGTGPWRTRHVLRRRPNRVGAIRWSTSAASCSVHSPFSGANTAPSLARAAKTGTHIEAGVGPGGDPVARPDSPARQCLRQPVGRRVDLGEGELSGRPWPRRSALRGGASCVSKDVPDDQRLGHDSITTPRRR